MRIPIVGNESEDFRRDPVDWCNRVPPEPNQAEDLESFLLESIELKHDTRQSRSTRSFCTLFDLSLVWSRRDPADTAFSPPTRHISPLQTYFAPKFNPCRMSLAARKCWDIGEPLLAVGENMTAGNVDHGDQAPCGIHLTNSNPASQRNVGRLKISSSITMGARSGAWCADGCLVG